MYLTYDLGTTALKTALIADDGGVLAVDTAEYSPRSPHPDWAEMPPEEYWKAAVEGARAVFSHSGASPSALAAIGFSSQGQTFIPIDPAGRPLHDAIVWLDNRAQEIVDEWEASWEGGPSSKWGAPAPMPPPRPSMRTPLARRAASLTREEFRRTTGYPWLPASLTVFKIAWLARHAPHAHRAWKFLWLPDYLIYRLTGEMATDRVIAHFGGLYDYRAGNWDPRLLAAAGIAAEQLPAILEPGTVAGQVRAETASELGIKPGVPVCVGANDQLVGALGAGNVRPGIATEATGTALAVIATTREPLDDPRVCVGRHIPPDAFYALAFTITSAVVLKWFRDLCAPGETYERFLAGVEEVPPGCDGLTVLPHFTGTGTPTYNPHVRGAFVGLSLSHTRAHMARAIMEACACMLQECLEPICEHAAEIGAGPAPRACRAAGIACIRSLGGAARSDPWLQMKADLLGIPVERPTCSDAASLGAAMLAATGIGRFASVLEAAEAWYRAASVFEPDASRQQIYREVYERYRRCCVRLYGDTDQGTQGMKNETNAGR